MSTQAVKSRNGFAVNKAIGIWLYYEELAWIYTEINPLYSEATLPQRDHDGFLWNAFL